MGLKDRNQKNQYDQGQMNQSARQASPSPIQLSPRDLFAIVDGELVNVIGTTDIPGMSPAYWCADNDGHSAPVSHREARIFTSAQQALTVLEQEGRIGNRRGVLQSQS